jgi:hypothetical protein
MEGGEFEPMTYGLNRNDLDFCLSFRKLVGRKENDGVAEHSKETLYAGGSHRGESRAGFVQVPK